jgi:hypothetical protein
MSIKSLILENPLLQDINNFFSKQSYTNKTPEAMAHSLSYLIALNQPDSVILPYIDKIDKSKISKESPFHKVTPLGLAVMKGRESLVKKLLDNGADPDTADAFGWTPLIHSAISTDSVAKMLLSKSCCENKRALNGLTFSSLKEMTTDSATHPGLDRLMVENDEGNLVKPSRAEAEAIMGIDQYRTKSLFRPENLRQLWDRMDTMSTMDRGYMGIYLMGKKKPLPKVAIKKDLPLAELGLERAKGLYANQFIEEKRFLGEYTGLGVELPEEDPFLSVMIGMTPHAIYRLGDVDAEKFGNETRMINDGFPNVCPIPAGHENVFITLRDINKGEEILFSYGPGEYFLRWGKYFVKNKQEIEDYMDQDFDRLFEMDELFLAQKKAGYVDYDTIFDRIKHSSSLGYILCSPQVLFHLFVSKRLESSLYRELKKLSYIQELDNTYQTHSLWIGELVEKIEELCDHLESIEDKSTQTEVRKFFLSLEGKLDMFQILFFMKKFRNSIKEESCKSAYEWERHLYQLYEEAKAYSFHAFDDNMPLFESTTLLHKGDMRIPQILEANSFRLSLGVFDEDDACKVCPTEHLETEDKNQLDILLSNCPA